MFPSRLPAWAVGLLLLSSLPTRADDARVDYRLRVKPILAARCYSCHGALQQKSGLRLDTVSLLKKGGDKGSAIVPGRSAQSPLLDHLLGANGSRRMPPSSEGDPLKPAEIAAIRIWIDQGANGPADEKPEVDPRNHYAFKTPVRPPVPKVRNSTWVRNPIDAFIAAEQDKHGLSPQPPADRRLLLRRVYLDLIGLPPTREQQADFLADTSSNAYEKVVERLLHSKEYGERWGRHWMDVWRYSDPWGLGAEIRNSQKHIWHWRDWIIESLNSDKGYDQMVREMLAADELYPNDPDRLRATGFLARSYFKFNRNSWLEEVVEHTSKAFLGLTMNCSKCHDHKYDPIAQQDFYRLRAFFEPYQLRTDMAPGQTDFEKDGIPRAFDCDLETPTYLFVRGDEKQPRKSRPLTPGLPALLAPARLEINPVALPPEAHAPGLRPVVLDNHLKVAEHQIALAAAALDQARKRLAEVEKGKGASPSPGSLASTGEQARLAVLAAEKELVAARLQPVVLHARADADRARALQPPPPNVKEVIRAAARAERQGTVASAEAAVASAGLAVARSAVGKKGEFEKKLVAARQALVAARKSLDSPGENYTSLRGSLKTLASNLETEASRNKPFPATSSGRRSALAKWMTDASNPLTARVAVNHIWARHFAKPLVPTVFDFGRKGLPPTHPELLDWLAVEFRENGWSMKHLHRLIVTSNTYRMTSSSVDTTARNRAVDADNRYYWRMNSLRMEAQVIRDSLLHLSGELDLTLGGPPIPVTDETSRRRSLYFVHSHNEHQRFLAMFDDANPLECYRRAESIIPQQALTLQNSRMPMTAAEKMAQRLDSSSSLSEDGAFVRAAFELVLSSTPTSQEQLECAKALKELQELGLRQKRPDARRRARTTLIHALLNHNDFVTIR